MALGGCAVSFHVEAGIRADSRGADLHAGVSLGIGLGGRGEGGSFTQAIGVDVDSADGGRLSTTTAYLGPGPGSFYHSARLQFLDGGGARLGGELLYALRRTEELDTVLGGDAVSRPRSVSLVLLGAQLSATRDDDRTGAALDAVFELHP